MSIFDDLRSKQVSTHTAVICVVSFLVVAGVSIKAAINSVNSPAEPARASAPDPPAPGITVKAVPAGSRWKTAGEPDSSDKPVLAARSTGDPYRAIMTRDLFHPVISGGQPNPGPSSPPPSGNRQVPPMPVAPLPGGPRPNSPPRGGDSDSKRSLAFTGSVTTSKGAQALIENLSTKEIRFVSQGETAFGCRVVSIASQSVSLDKDGAEFTLALGENKPDTTTGSGSPPSGGSQPPGGSQPGGGSPPSGGSQPPGGSGGQGGRQRNGPAPQPVPVKG